MGKSHAHRQKEYREHLKERDPEMFLKQGRDRKRIQREGLKKTTKQKIEWEKENKKSE